jgi:hypothetical protein
MVMKTLSWMDTRNLLVDVTPGEHIIYLIVTLKLKRFIFIDVCRSGQLLENFLTA